MTHRPRCGGCYRRYDKNRVLEKRGREEPRIFECAECGQRVTAKPVFLPYGTVEEHETADGVRCAGSERPICGDCGLLDCSGKIPPQS